MEGKKCKVLTDILPLEFATLIGQSRWPKRYCGLVIKVKSCTFYICLINQVNATMEQCLQV